MQRTYVSTGISAISTFVFLAGMLTLGASHTAFGSTAKHISGIITSIEGTTITISGIEGRKTVVGRVDTSRTHVLLNGKPAHAADLKITYDAKAELALDDVWMTIQAEAH